MSWLSYERAALRLIRRCRFLHGSELMDLAIEHGLGACADSYAIRTLRAEMLPNHPAPNHSQRAFASLGGCAAKDFSVCAAGAELAWYWQMKPRVPKLTFVAHKLRWRYRKRWRKSRM